MKYKANKFNKISHIKSKPEKNLPVHFKDFIKDNLFDVKHLFQELSAETYLTTMTEEQLHEFFNKTKIFKYKILGRTNNNLNQKNLIIKFT